MFNPGGCGSGLELVARGRVKSLGILDVFETAAGGVASVGFAVCRRNFDGSRLCGTVWIVGVRVLLSLVKLRFGVDSPATMGE